MSNFIKAFEFLLRREGGFVNNPLDMGGPTNMGITQGDLAHFYNRPISIEEVKELKPEIAQTFYRLRFWEHMKLDAVESSKIAVVIFDQGVLRGQHRIIQDIQHILGLDPDGIMGPQTIEE